MNKLLMGLMTLTACSQPADRGAEIDALKARVDKLEAASTKNQAETKKTADAVFDALIDMGLMDRKDNYVQRWWCLTNSACVRSKDACEKSARKMIAAGAPIVCHPVRVAFCETKTPQCWADLEACSLGGGDTCRGAE